jgi:hypothetical protein
MNATGADSMYIDLIVWDSEDDPEGNVRHILGPGEVTLEEVEEVLRSHVWALRRER